MSVESEHRHAAGLLKTDICLL